MRIALIGAGGRLGAALVRAFTAAGAQVIPADRGVLEITDYAAVRAFIGATAPDVVINAAAWTHVDGCAEDPDRAYRINGLAAGGIATAAAAVGAAIVQISTNEVFAGDGNTPYREYDLPRAINAYGDSKLVGERAVMAVNPRHWIVRTAWLFAHGGKNFVQTIIGAAAAGKPLRVVTDEVANPTYTDDLALAIVELAASGRFGIYHLVNAGCCSRYDLARFVLDRSGWGGTPIEPIRQSDWQRSSTPPRYSALANNAGASIGVSLRDWRSATEVFLAREGLLRS